MIERDNKQKDGKYKEVKRKKAFGVVNEGRKPTIKQSNESAFKGKCIEGEVKGDQLDVYPISTIGKIVGRRDGQVVCGTGFLIDQSVVLTCAHNIYHHRSEQIKVPFELKAEEIKFLLYDRKTKCLREYTVKQVHFPEQFKTEDDLTSMENDYGVLVLADSLEDAKGFLATQFSFIDSLTSRGNFIVSGFHGKQQFIRQSCNNESTKFEVSGSFITHQLSTEQGSSGSPFLVEKKNGLEVSYSVIGVHIKGKGNPYKGQYNVAKCLDYRMFHKINEWLYYESNTLIVPALLNGLGLSEQQLEAKLALYSESKKYLRELQAKDNKIEKIPPILFDSKFYLRRLILESNHLSSISDICEFQYICYLNVNNNHIEEIPETISTLLDLKVFLIANNKLRILPEALTLLKIEELDVSENLLFLWDKQEQQSEGQQVSMSQQASIQWECIGAMPSLKKLSVRNLRIPYIERLPMSLCELDVSENKITELGIENADQLKNLRKINASNNKIEQIISNMINLKNVEILLIGNNLEAIKKSQYFIEVEGQDQNLIF